MKKSFILVCCMIIILTAAAYAQGLSFEQLAANVEQQLNGIFDMHAVVDLEVVQFGQVTFTTLDLKTSKEGRLTRLEMLAPDLVVGQIYLFDPEKEEVSIYMPMLGQILVQSLATASGQFGLSLDFADMDHLFSLGGIQGEIDEIIPTDQGLNYRVKVTDLGEQVPLLGSAATNPRLAVQYVWIDANYMPYRIEYYEGDVCLGKMVIREYELNMGIPAEELRNLPDVPIMKF
ncbi:MAG TPA: hypothetical protein GX739_05370 [Firmicutes bacterium]|nr:hypothetical protein [Bacillota bacterium]